MGMMPKDRRYPSIRAFFVLSFRILSSAILNLPSQMFPGTRPVSAVFVSQPYGWLNRFQLTLNPSLEFNSGRLVTSVTFIESNTACGGVPYGAHVSNPLHGDLLGFGSTSLQEIKQGYTQTYHSLVGSTFSAPRVRGWSVGVALTLSGGQAASIVFAVLDELPAAYEIPFPYADADYPNGTSVQVAGSMRVGIEPMLLESVQPVSTTISSAISTTSSSSTNSSTPSGGGISEFPLQKLWLPLLFATLLAVAYVGVRGRTRRPRSGG
jgi:hypothetical protein